MSRIAERGSTHVYKVNRISKEEIEQMTGLCIHDEPPFCNAACPLKVDVRSFLSFAASGNWKKALQIYEKATPFPLILSQGCDAPCAEKCRLCEIGDAIQIREVEHAAALYGTRTVTGGVFRMKKKKTVAVYGSDLFCLFLAGELERKMYPVTVFTACADPEIYLHTAAPELTGKPFTLELERLKSMDLSFRFGVSEIPAAFRGVAENTVSGMDSFDILCVSDAVLRETFPEALIDGETMTSGVVANGIQEIQIIAGAAAPHEPVSVLNVAFSAKRAALSVDRLAQNLNPHSNRGTEGAVKSRLYTDLSQASQLHCVLPSAQFEEFDSSEGSNGSDGSVGTEGFGSFDSSESSEVSGSFNNSDGSGDPVRAGKCCRHTRSVYTPEEAADEAKRCLQCRCEECMKGCEFLKRFQKYPNLLAREIYNNTQIIMGDHPLNRVMNACALCGQCKVVCPNGFDMAKVCKNARENMVSTDKMSLAVHEFALLDMLFSNGDAFLCRPQPGYEEKPCRYVFFPGCQAAAVAPETVRAAYMDLISRLEGGVALMLGCCGAICDWAGRYEMYAQTSAFLGEELKKLGDPVVIAGCPTCKKQLSSHPGVAVKGIWEILETIGLPDRGCSDDSSGSVPAALSGAFSSVAASAFPDPSASAVLIAPSDPSASAVLTSLSNPAASAVRSVTSVSKRRVAVHDSCGARGDAETQRSVRRILEALGCEVVETELSGDRSPCCGYGGLTSHVNRELANKMTEKCLSRSEEFYVTYCMACRDRFIRDGRESGHLLELVYGQTPAEPPDISVKRANRLLLKQKLLKELWNEETELAHPDFEIQYTPEARKLIAGRMILQSDVTDVLLHLRETGAAVYDRTSRHCVTSCRLDNVTFWVVYDEIPEGYLVHRAYSHRMTVEKREG